MQDFSVTSGRQSWTQDGTPCGDQCGLLHSREGQLQC